MTSRPSPPSAHFTHSAHSSPSAIPPEPPPPVLTAERLGVRFGDRVALKDVSLAIPRGRIVSIIGPSESGKTTLLRSFNRMNELVSSAETTGTVRFGGLDLHGAGVDPVEVRRRIGMVFQETTPFPKSVFDNVAFGPRASGFTGDLQVLVEEVLTAAGLWSEVAEDLDAPAVELSAGQKQRLCIARTLALGPDVLLLDEPTAALDAEATARIESIIRSLSPDYSIVIATRNRWQAARLSDLTGFLDRGELLEYGPTETVFTNPREARTESYLTGRTP